MVLLHGFVKKTRTQPNDLALGRERQKAVKQEQAALRKEKGKEK